MEETNWDNYGTGKNPKCDNCMAHCGYEGTAVNDMFANPLKAIKVHMKGPKLEGEMAPALPILYERNTASAQLNSIPVTQEKQPENRV